MAKKKEKWDLNEKLQAFVDKIEIKYGEQPLNLDEDIAGTRISFGSLCLDLIAGGGIPAGKWLTWWGGEGTGKSTSMYSAIKSAVDAGVKMIDVFDFESSLHSTYFANIMEEPLQKVLGKKNEDGEWIIKPKVRQYIPDHGEIFFYMVARKLLKMPYVISLKGKRYLKFSDKLAKEVKLPKENIAFEREGFKYVLDKGPPIKYAVFIDSFPEMVPKSLKDDPEKSPMAKQARMFSDLIPLVRTPLKHKGAFIMGVNHLRFKPMVMFGAPDYMPLGEHLKHATDLRIRTRDVSIPGGKGKIAEEMNLNGEMERFSFIKYKTDKNKTFPKGKECILRVCLEVGGESGYGIDPVWDVFEYLRMTNQIKKRGNKVNIFLPGPWEEIDLEWDDIKRLVTKPTSKELLSKILKFKPKKKQKISKAFADGQTAIRKALKIKNKKAKIKKIKEILDIKKVCLKQIHNRTAFKLAAKGIKVEEEE